MMPEYIERTNLIARIRYYLEHTTVNCGEHYAYSVALKEVLNCPAADVAPVVHGRIVGLLEDGRYRRRFSCCGEDATMITQWAWPKYCPNCGAKMDGGAENA